MSNTPNINDLISFPVKYDEHGGYFYDRSNNMIAQVRGFGRLSYTGKGNRDFEAAAKKQNLLGQFIADAINNAAQMKTEIENLQAKLSNAEQYVKALTTPLTKDWTSIRASVMQSLAGCAKRTDVSGLKEAIDVLISFVDRSPQAYLSQENERLRAANEWRRIQSEDDLAKQSGKYLVTDINKGVGELYYDTAKKHWVIGFIVYKTKVIGWTPLPAAMEVENV